MFTAKVYRVMVGSLSGAMEEVYVAKETIQKWNQQNSENTGKVFMPIEWASEPEVIQNVDIVVGIIDNWLDNPKIIEDVIEAGKQVMLFFYASNDSSNTISGELELVRVFHNYIEKRCCCSGFIDFEELKRNLKERLFMC